MDIKTKFEPGQKVYFYKKPYGADYSIIDCIEEASVNRMKITFDIQTGGSRIFYGVNYSDDIEQHLLYADIRDCIRQNMKGYELEISRMKEVITDGTKRTAYEILAQIKRKPEVYKLLKEVVALETPSTPKGPKI